MHMALFGTYLTSHLIWETFFYVIMHVFLVLICFHYIFFFMNCFRYIYNILHFSLSKQKKKTLSMFDYQLKKYFWLLNVLNKLISIMFGYPQKCVCDQNFIYFLTTNISFILKLSFFKKTWIAFTKEWKSSCSMH